MSTNPTDTERLATLDRENQKFMREIAALQQERDEVIDELQDAQELIGEITKERDEAQAKVETLRAQLKEARWQLFEPLAQAVSTPPTTDDAEQPDGRQQSVRADIRGDTTAGDHACGSDRSNKLNADDEERARDLLEAKHGETYIDQVDRIAAAISAARAEEAHQMRERTLTVIQKLRDAWAVAESSAWTTPACEQIAAAIRALPESDK